MCVTGVIHNLQMKGWLLCGTFSLEPVACPFPVTLPWKQTKNTGNTFRFSPRTRKVQRPSALISKK